MRKVYLFIAFFISIFIFNVSNLLAVGSGGFENASLSTAALSQGNAVTAQADEPGAISYNPAGIINLPGLQVQTNTHFISVLTFVNSPRDENLRSSGTIVPVPTGYLTLNPGEVFSNRVAFGVGSDSPFGLSNKWDSNDPHVHYAGWVNYLKMYTVKPVISVKLTDWLSMGGGPVYYRIFDFGGIQAYPNAIAAGSPFFTGLTTDGQVRLNLSGNTWGWQYGLLARPWEKHSFGLYFRSPVTVQTKGRIKVENSSSGNFETGGSAKVDLPLNLTFGYAFSPSEKTTIEADFGFTRWSSFERLYFNHTPVNLVEDTILNAIGFNDKDYGNSYSIHLGGNRKITNKLVLRGGGWFYTSAVPQDHYIPAVADANRLGVVLGLGYNFTKNLNIDLCYYNAFVFKRKIANTISESLGQSVDGVYSSYIQDFSIGLTYKWDDLFQRKSKENISNSIITTQK